jgi:hypothetical protein
MLDLKSLELPPDLVANGKQPGTPTKRKKRETFIRTPFSWWEKLSGCHGQTLAVALFIIHLDWKSRGCRPVKLANGALDSYGISRRTKWRALKELESLGLITVERRVGKSPIIQILQAT